MSIATAAAAVALAVGGSAMATDPPSPADWVELVDETGTISVPVPTDWDDISTAPVHLDGVTATPTIAAATDLAAFYTSFDAAGVTMLALGYNPNTDATLEHYGLATGCLQQRTDDYDDGAFSGAIRHWSRCGDENTQAEVFNLAVSPADRSLTLAIHLQILDPDDRWIADTILESFNVLPLSTAEGGAVTLYDQLGALIVEVPARWDDVALHADATMPDAYASIVATTDLESFLEDPSVTGVGYHAEPYTPDTAERLEALGTYGCQTRPASKYSDDIFTGHVRTATCGSTGVRQVQVAAGPPDETFTAVLTIRVAPLSNDELHLVLDSFTYDPSVTSNARRRLIDEPPRDPSPTTVGYHPATFADQRHAD